MQLGEERRDQSRAFAGNQRIDLSWLEPDAPFGVGHQEGTNQRFLGIDKCHFPATRVRLDFFTLSCEAFFTRFQFAEATWTEGPEGVADSVQEPDLRLQGGSVA